MSVSAIALTPSQTNEITDYVNNYRSKHQAPPMSWDTVIYTTAQAWSAKLVSKHIMQHSNNALYGENLAYFQGYGVEPVSLIKKSIDAWYNEIASYDFTKPGFSATTGHFTCLVWKSSTSFAVGISIDPVTTEAYVVMNTSPPGNYLGQFQQNVLPVVVPSVPPAIVIPPVVAPPVVAPPVVAPPAELHKKREIYKLMYGIAQAVYTNQPKVVIIGIINNIIQLLDSSPVF
jgi:hypothetical protein